MPNSSYWPESKGARAGERATVQRLWKYASRCLGFNFYFRSPGDGRVRAQIQARGGGLPVVSPA